jgi:Transposase DDE domain
MLGNTSHLAEAIYKDLEEMLPKQRKTQRRKLALLTAVMLQAKTANTMDLAAHLPLKTERQDMRFQWIFRFLSNPLVNLKTIMPAIGKPLLEKLAKTSLILIIDQTHIYGGEELLMVSVRFGARALPLIWKAKKTEGEIGFEDQKELLDLVSQWLPEGAKVILLGDRFYGTADLIAYCRSKKWDYRLRLKSNIKVFYGLKECLSRDLEKLGLPFLKDVCITDLHQQTHIGIIHEEGYPSAWIVAMSQNPNFYTVFDYGMRWSIEPMFADFKSRGFGLSQTHIRYPDRLERLILIMALAMIWASLSGLWDALHHPLPYEKGTSKKHCEASSLISSEAFAS